MCSRSLRKCDETMFRMPMNSGCHMFQFMHQGTFECAIVGKCVESFKRFPQHNHQVVMGALQLPTTTGVCV